MLSTTSKVAWIVAVAYLALFFALASGMINAIVEGRNIKGFILPTRSVQTIGETVVTTLVLFMGMAGALMLYQSGRSANPKAQAAAMTLGLWGGGTSVPL